ncbi:MAG: hypothetical protein GY729_11830 [Desulfobacteraceae bacterium]|nr:hypothetical protein [Desulfobacteraceae bacterium]
MNLKNRLQTQLLGSVFAIVILTIFSITALMAYLDQKQLHDIELSRIFYQTQSIKKRMGHLMHSSNWRYIILTLSNSKRSDPSMLYYLLTDNNGSILIADNEKYVGKSAFELASIKNVNAPILTDLLVEANPAGKPIFTVFLSQMNKALYQKGELKAQKQEIIFDTFWDIHYMGEKLGSLRIGFSRKGVIENIMHNIIKMLVTGGVILIAAMIMIYYFIRKSMYPLENFINQLSGVYQDASEKNLQERLFDLNIKIDMSAANEIVKLQKTFLKIRDLFVRNFEQLENHRTSLETEVDQRTSQLNEANQKLREKVEERKEIETRLLQVQKLESIATLAGGVAHEFNNLFTAIAGNASLIKKTTDPLDSAGIKANKILELVAEGAVSIKQLLGFAQSEKFDPGRLNLNEVIKLNLDIFVRTRKDLEIIKKYSQDLWAIYADKSQVEQMVMNLLLNASDAMPGLGTITIETQNIILEKKRIGVDRIISGRFVQFSVKDTGPGIKKDVIQRVFDPFFSTKTSGYGSGLGLSSVYGIVDNHGGFTTVESAMGKGAVFSVFLPAILQA